jgi:Domain of unknown function (DUF4209)
MSEQSYRDVLNAFEQRTVPFTEHAVADELRKVRSAYEDSDEDPPQELAWEEAAFCFCANYPDPETGWGTYYGPMIVTHNSAGESVEYPSPGALSPQVLQYWRDRAEEAKHPVLAFRYADLVADLADLVKDSRFDHSAARIAIDSAIAMAEQDLHEYEVASLHSLERALSLALRINDCDCVDRVAAAILEYEDKVAEDDKLGLWGFSFDELVGHNKIPLSSSQEQKIVKDLTDRLDRVTSLETRNAHAAQAAALRLAQYHRKAARPEDMRAALLRYGEAARTQAQGAPSLAASIALQEVHSTYLEYGLREEATAIEADLRSVALRAKGDLKEISTTVTITDEELESFEAMIVRGTLGASLDGIAGALIPKKNQALEELQNHSKDAPLTFMFQKQILDDDGRPIATIGPLDRDPEGQTVHHIANGLYVSSLFLRRAFEGVFRAHRPGAENIVAHLVASPVFGRSRQHLIALGIEAWIEGQHEVAAHLLVPQIECGFRKVLEICGGALYRRRRRGGGLSLRALDDIVRDPLLTQLFGEDAQMYFRIVLTDQRGWNLRNAICHGLVEPGHFDSLMVDRLVHVLLCLAGVRAVDESDS